uniref:Uncharacterized protein n=1 Tax=Picea sitchensis TaxID=3332 RepID=A9NLA8_PICSI|nr:unknown [Picea sitchensis]
MGSCVSSNATSSVPATAKLILIDGSLKEFCEELRSQEILREYPGHFICNSDGLYIGRNISQVLRDDDQLRIGQLYCLLPRRKLQFVLTDSDMASLLCKINTALLALQEKKRQSRRLSWGFCKAQVQVQPLFDIHSQHDHDESGEEYYYESSSSLCCMSRLPNIPNSIPTRRGRNHWQSKLEPIEESL